MWSHRLILESLSHNSVSFLTLTYAELPPLGSLLPRDLTLFLKRLRWRWQMPLRYYAVGEYGSLTERPHYHLVLYGYPNCSNGRTRHTRSVYCCPSCDLVREEWSLGFIDLGEFNEQSAAYVAGYVTKKMTSSEDIRLDGRHPEFARMSRRPGLGFAMAQRIAHELKAAGVTDWADAPRALRHGKRLWPMGQALSKRVRDGMEVESTWSDDDERRHQALSALLRATGSQWSVTQALHDEMAGEASKVKHMEQQGKRRRSL